jgi:2-C-methyl-D-erythritol 4-phosphate cytidylyltransferase
MRIAAVIPVAGSGKRFSSAIPKQFQPIDGQPLITLTLNRILTTGLVNQLVLVHAPEHKQEFSKIISKMTPGSTELLLTAGGATRQESVYNGLQQVAANTDIVIIHDGVRPLVSERMIREGIKTAARYGACITALPVRDTIKKVRNGLVLNTVPREDLWQIQTPQTFRYPLLMEIHNKAKTEKFCATDDAALAEWFSAPVHVINGEDTNIKITTAADLEFLKFYLENN